jgi:hypothetical protein
MQANDIIVPNALQNNPDMGKVFVNHINVKEYKDQIQLNLKNQSSDKVKLGCLKMVQCTTSATLSLRTKIVSCGYQISITKMSKTQ